MHLDSLTQIKRHSYKTMFSYKKNFLTFIVSEVKNLTAYTFTTTEIILPR